MTPAEREADARKKINDLIQWFSAADLPVGPVKLYPGTMITDVKKFVGVNLERLKGQNIKSKDLQASYIHLTDLKTIICKSQPKK